MFLERDTSPLWATHLTWLLLIFLGPSACGAPEVATDLTGLRITVHYDSALGIDQLLVVGRMGGATIFGPDLLPRSATGDLSPEGESVVVLDRHRRRPGGGRGDGRGRRARDTD